MRRNRRFIPPSARGFSWRLRTVILLAVALVAGFAASSVLLHAGDEAGERIPSNVSWTPENIAAASNGDAFRGLLLAKRCDHCHGAEGFSAEGYTPNLAGMKRLAIWKQLEDFKSRKRTSKAMNPIAESLTERDIVDVVAYFSALPLFPDPQDNRAFPRGQSDATHSAMASRLITFGDGERGIPPCQACHGPVAYKVGVPSLMTQNGDYVLNQLEAFANRTRTNDINEPMRVIAGLLSEDERHAIAEYYGAGLGMQPAGAK